MKTIEKKEESDIFDIGKLQENWAKKKLPENPGPSPQKTNDEKRRSTSIARRNSLPSPRMCCWPANSSIERGRILEANGASWAIFFLRLCSKRSIVL